MTMEWVWLKKGWGVADGGAYAKLFQGKGSVEDIVAREVTQNSWDAANRLKTELLETNQGQLPNDYKFKLVYEFKDLLGREKQNLIATLRLTELEKRLKKFGNEELEFEEGSTCLDHMSDESPIKCLYIHDYGATGLRGDPTGENLDESDFYRAFGQIGGNDRRVGGGSFGFGKSAFIKASRLRCVIAYSSFAPTAEDPVKTRLWGFVFWKGHKGGFAGFAQLGSLIQNSDAKSSPLCDKQADEVAKALGFRPRNADTHNETGTSLLVVDQTLDPALLLESLEKFWWPAVETFKNDFDVQIHTDTEIMKLRPMQREYLRSFVRAFEIATDKNAQIVEDNEMKFGIAEKDTTDLIGNLALVRVIDPVSVDGLTTNNASNLVALIRDPRMVVQYQPHNNNAPIVQGVFVAESNYDSYLRSSEPGPHDIWDTKIDESHGRNWQRTKKVVNGVQDGIKKELIAFQKKLRPASVTPPDSLEFADEILAEIFEPKDSGTSKKKSTKPKVKVGSLATKKTTSRKREVIDQNQIKFIEKYEWELLKSAKDNSKVRVQPGVWILADGNETSSSDRLGVKILTCSPEFKIEANGSIVGVAKKGVTYFVEYETEPYSSSWNIKPDLDISLDAGAGMKGSK